MHTSTLSDVAVLFCDSWRTQGLYNEVLLLVLRCDTLHLCCWALSLHIVRDGLFKKKIQPPALSANNQQWTSCTRVGLCPTSLWYGPVPILCLVWVSAQLVFGVGLCPICVWCGSVPDWCLVWVCAQLMFGMGLCPNCVWYESHANCIFMWIIYVKNYYLTISAI